MSYYIKVNDTFYYMDSTTSINVNFPAKLSSNPLFNNKEASDHYIIDKPTMSISGVISDIKGYGALSELGASEYLDGLLRARNNSSPVSVKYRLDKAEDSGWFITSINPNQDKNNGFSGVGSDGAIRQSFSISIQLEKPLVTGSLVVDTNPKVQYRTSLQDKKSSSQAVENFDESQRDKNKIEEYQEAIDRIASKYRNEGQ